MQLLLTKSEELTCKVDDTSKVVEDFKCAFQNLDRDVEALEGIESLVATQERENEIKMEEIECEENDQLNSIESLLEEKKETAEAIRNFTHPCGGPGWKLVTYTDYRIEPCPHGFQTGLDGRPHVCVPVEMPATSAMTCRAAPLTYPTEDYSSVCGRIAAYQIGLAAGFEGSLGMGSALLNQAYLSGISLTNTGTLGDMTNPLIHIWSFAVGETQSQSSSAPSHRCPCDAGSFSAPSFVGENYFCEGGNTGVMGDPGTLYAGNVLWDGLGCIPDSDCCSRMNHPYFVRHLGTTTQDLMLRFCYNNGANSENFALELIELYIK